MVSIAGRFCIDRYEASVVDDLTGRELSPYYPPHKRIAQQIFTLWTERVEKERLEALGLDAGVEAGPLTDLRLDASVGEPSVRVPIVLANVTYSIKPQPGLDAGAPHDGVAGDASSAQADAAELRPMMDLPALPSWQLEDFKPRAVSRAGVVPQGYTPGFVAREACRAAGKRLCREDEWVQACKGQRGTKFPYGDDYRQGVCNVFRHDHPARILHGDFSTGLSDPRLNMVTLDGEPLLQKTGDNTKCKSVWGQDAVYDMVGNLDEWVDDPAGAFVGGFYSRNTRNGCEARVGSHPTSYFDYSLGFRCCADLAGAP